MICTCEYANIPICDRIFTRVGASDDLSQGQSTFMVEMSEVSHILKNATDKSLVILDEIGRGTSTYDGISLAWSIVEYIQNNIKCKTLFATHYHELTDLENEFSDVKNYSIAVKEDNEGIVFLRKIIPQGADKSYGIYVAQLAKLPEEVINRSKEILKDLEKNHINNSVAIKKDNIKLNNSYDSIDNVQVDLTSLVNTNMNINEKVNIEKVSNLEKEVEKLKLENNQLAKNYKNVKNDYDKLNKDYNELSENLESSVIRESAITQISFEGINGNDLVEDILELDILSMTPLDAMNALFNLQKKAKDKK